LILIGDPNQLPATVFSELLGISPSSIMEIYKWIPQYMGDTPIAGDIGYTYIYMVSPFIYG
jgi:uncharacterized membrane protein